VGAAGIGSRRSQLATRYEAARRGDRLGAPRRNTPLPQHAVFPRHRDLAWRSPCTAPAARLGVSRHGDRDRPRDRV